MVIYIKNNDIYSDIIKMISISKGVNADIINVSGEGCEQHLEDLSLLTPDTNIPTLIYEDDIVIHDYRIMLESLDDIYPYPHLLPVFPKQKAEIRVIVKFINDNIIPELNKLILNTSNVNKDKVVKKIKTYLLEVYKFVDMERDDFYEEMNVLDFLLNIIFYYMVKLKISIPRANNKVVLNYIKKLLSNPYFKECMKGKE